MELRYNLTRDDYLRGLSLHEGRLKGPLSVLRLAARLLFLLPTGVGALGLLMLGVVRVWGEWEEAFTWVLGPLLAMLLLSALEVYLLSPRRRAGRRLRVNRPDAAFFGPHVVTLTAEGVTVRYGDNRLVLPWGQLTEIWTKKGFCLLYTKSGPWEVLPPCAFEHGAQREAFAAALHGAMSGDVPQEREEPGGGEAERLPQAEITLEYTWETAELCRVLTQANLRYVHTRLFWTPVRIVMSVLGPVVLLTGILTGIGVGTSIPREGTAEWLYALGIVLIGLGLCVPLLMLLPPVLRFLVSRQERKGALRSMLDGPQRELWWSGGMVSLHGGERETARWDQVAAVCSEEEGLFLFRRDNKLHVFPAKAFPDWAAQEAAAEYARSHMQK